MLTTSTILMSLGSDLPNAHQISSDRTDTPAISFAESFDKSATSKDEMELQSDSGKKIKNDCEAKQIVPSIKMDGTDSVGIKMKSGASGGVTIQEKYKNISSSIVSKNATLPTITSETLSGNKPSHEDILKAIKVEIANNQLPSGDVKGVEKAAAEITDSDIPASADNSDASKAEVSTSTTPPVLSNGTATISKNQNEILIPNKNGNTIPSKTMVKGHDSISKAEKSAKIKNKTNNIVAPLGNLVEAGQKAIVIPGLAPQVDRQQDGWKIEQNDLLSSLDVETPESSTKPKSMLANKPDQKTTVTAELDSHDAKAEPFSVDDTSSLKVGAELSKPGLPIPSTMDSDSAKAQSVATGGITAGLTHIEPGMVATTFGGAAGSIAAQGVTPKALTPEINSHTANIHTDPRAMDASGAIDVTHQTLMATPTSLEVGVANGTHGWLKIRAEMTVGGVNASLSSATSSGQEMLHRELPSLTAYLQSERVAVSTVVLQPVIVPGTNSQQFASGMNDGGRGQATQSDGQGGQQSRQEAAGAAVNLLERDESYRDAGKDKLVSSVSYARGGRWLNVRA